jgi:DNA polymerase-3 subunit beta
MNILSGVYISAAYGHAGLRATNLRTSLACEADGVDVLEPGEAVLPVRGVSDLFSKAAADELTLEISDGKAKLASGKSRYRFTVYPASDFPKLPSSSGGKFIFSMDAGGLALAIEQGSLCASLKDAYPPYLSSAYFDVTPDGLTVVSTDKIRIALGRALTAETGEASSFLLPMSGVRELLRLLSAQKDTCVKVFADDSQAYFVLGGTEFSARKTDARFPGYAALLPAGAITSAEADKADLLAALERADIVTRDYGRTAVISLGHGPSLTLFARSIEFGEAAEALECVMTGEPVRAGFHTKYLMEGVKSCGGDTAVISFETPKGSMSIKPKGSNRTLYIIAPVELNEDELAGMDGAAAGGVSL